MSRFPLVHISGDPWQRGQQHGEILKQEIAQTIDFYHSIFNLRREEIFSLANRFKKIIGDFEADYVDEMAAIARAADVEAEWIIALNARTEILSRNSVVSNECTAVYLREQSILGQNWDWGKALEPLTVLMNIIQPDGHAIAMMTEPGIIGKIGMNSCDLGVCLNILTLGQVLNGLPVHVVLRAILDCRSIKQVESLLAQHGCGKASNLIVADASGNGFDMEFCGEQSFRLDPEANMLIHTNHYLGDKINSPSDPAFFSSYAR
ncbi:MAG: peptidase C45, partial [Gammaproteobacteria bacterium]|nr:peptidase C45 [Gammaproteobacteria bacterium]